MGTVGEKAPRDVERKELVEPYDSPGLIASLIGRITDDLKALGRDEIALARAELNTRLKKTLVDTLVILLSAIIAMIAIGFLAVALVDAIAPILPPLWARLIVGALVFAGISTAILFGYAHRLRKDLPTGAPRAADEARRTAEAVKEELRHA